MNKKIIRSFKLEDFLYFYMKKVLLFIHELWNNDSKEDLFWYNMIFCNICSYSIFVWSSNFLNFVFKNVTFLVLDNFIMNILVICYKFWNRLLFKVNCLRMNCASWLTQAGEVRIFILAILENIWNNSVDSLWGTRPFPLPYFYKKEEMYFCF